MARGKTAKRDLNRINTPFLALPWPVLDSPSYLGLSSLAKVLLLDIARQYTGSNNGALLATAKVLAPRGWNSNDSITKAKAELLAAELIYQTCMGARPNKASWYAITWRPLDADPGFDVGAAEGFRVGAYKKKPPIQIRGLTPPTGVALHRPPVQ